MFVHHIEAQNPNFMKIFQAMTEIWLQKVRWGKRKFVPDFAKLSQHEITQEIAQIET